MRLLERRRREAGACARASLPKTRAFACGTAANREGETLPFLAVQLSNTCHLIVTAYPRTPTIVFPARQAESAHPDGGHVVGLEVLDHVGDRVDPVVDREGVRVVDRPEKVGDLRGEDDGGKRPAIPDEPEPKPTECVPCAGTANRASGTKETITPVQSTLDLISSVAPHRTFCAAARSGEPFRPMQ